MAPYSDPVAMLHVTHAAFSVFLSLLLYFVFPSLNNYVLAINWGIVAGFAALVPDIDHPQGYISRGNWRIVSNAVRMTTVHRGWTHSLAGAAFFTVASVIVFWYFHAKLLYAVPFFLGYVSHLVTDSLNPTMVKWLWPKEEKYGLPVIPTGSGAEMIFQTALILGGTGLFLYDMIYRDGLILGG